MQKFNDFKCDLYNNCKPIKSLFEVENFFEEFMLCKKFILFCKKRKIYIG